jgi:hypothetical protein
MEAAHFLSRLDRVSRPQLELALSLYRDAALVRELLSRARLPEGAWRVAVALDHAPDGAHLVVGRDGGFITCLGPGMSTDALPVISRAKLDSVAAQTGELRRRLEIAKNLAGEQASEKLMARLIEAGDALTREELLGCAAFAPLYQRELIGELLHLLRATEEHRRWLTRLKRPRPAYEEALNAYWRMVWATGHLAVVIAMGGNSPALENLIELDTLGAISLGAVLHGQPALALRALWAVARIGKPALPACKRLIQSDRSGLVITNGALGLTALYFGHSRMQAEIRKALSRRGDEPRAVFLRNLLGLIDRAPECRALLDDRGREWAVNLSPRFPEGSAYRFAAAGEVPESLALAAGVNREGEFFPDRPRSWMTRVVASLTRVAQARGEDLYLPAEYARRAVTPWRPEKTMAMLAAAEEICGKPRPARAEETPGRNERCPCGSGKKYKRCHGGVESDACQRAA